METEASPSFGALLKEYRLARGLTQETLAEAAGLSRDAINLLERGARRSPHRDAVTLLARALRLSGDERERLLAAAPKRRERAPEALPPRLTSFVGREREIGELRELVLATRLVTLSGPAGIGKTSLALAVACALQSRLGNRVWLVELAALADGDLVADAIASALGVRARSGEPILTTVAPTLGNVQRLLVLDNCEHLLLNCARVAEALLQACPRLSILTTSREPLRIGAETIWRVPPLTLPSREIRTFGGLIASEAVRLFVDRAEAVQPGFVLTDANAAAVVEICRRLDGIPLAIELAAARVSALTPDEIACHLTNRFRLLTTGSRTALPRHRSLQAALDWSHDLLPMREQTLLSRRWYRGVEALAGRSDASLRPAKASTPRYQRRDPPTRFVSRDAPRRLDECLAHGIGDYSTVTDFARLRGWSTSQPRKSAKW
jgi:predicted ATPase/DNA-binding XRE family transcriptional regulator